MPYTFTEREMKRLCKAMDHAPSIFGQRPWKLEHGVDGDGNPVNDRVDLYSAPDEFLGRMLPREVVISCGAALYNLRLAIQVAGRHPSVYPLPGLDLDSGLLTTVASRPTLYRWTRGPGQQPRRLVRRPAHVESCGTVATRPVASGVAAASWRCAAVRSPAAAACT